MVLLARGHKMLKRLLLLAALLGFASPAFAASFTVSASIVPVPLVSGETFFPIYIVGTGTSYSSGTVFTVTGGSGASVLSNSCSTATACVVELNPGTAAGTLTLSDGTNTNTLLASTPFQTLVNDNFNRPNTSAGGAGSQTGLGNNWIDVLGNIANIQNNQAYLVQNSTTYSDDVIRPLSENQVSQRYVARQTFMFAGYSPFLEMRKQASGAKYATFWNNSTFRLCNVSTSGVCTNLGSAGTALVIPGATDTVLIDCMIVNNGSGNPVFTCNYFDQTQGAAMSISAIDSSVAKITTAGQSGWGMNLVTTPAQPFTQMTTYYVSATSALVSPAAVQSSASNITLTFTGNGTSWVNGTTTAALTSSGYCSGAALGSLTVNSATSATATLTSSGPCSDSLVITFSTGEIVQVAVVAPTISLTPYIASQNSTNTITVSCNVCVWLTNAPSFSISGVAGTAITNTTVVNNVTATITVTVGATTGAATITDATYSASASLTIFFAIKMNDGNLFLSPDNWNKNGAIYAESNYAGAYLHVNITTTANSPIRLYFDSTTNIANGLLASNYPLIGYIVTQSGAIPAPRAKQQSTPYGNYITLLASAPAGTYDIYIDIANLEYNGSSDTGRWNPSAPKLRLIGISADPSAISNPITHQASTCLFFGDSITEGVGTLGLNSGTNNDSFYGYARTTALAVGCEYANFGLSGSAWSVNRLTVPAFYLSTNTPTTTIGYQEQGVSLLSGGAFPTAANYCFINLGTNDGTNNILPNMAGALPIVRTVCGPTAKIEVFTPFNQNENSNILAGIAAYKTSSGDTGIYNLNLGSTFCPIASLNQSFPATASTCAADDLHPLAWAAQAFAATASKLIGSQSNMSSNSILIIHH
jgi:lysophospholipase L1-like esterase